jgi:ricin-type beta-trefoil lectin protein
MRRSLAIMAVGLFALASLVLPAGPASATVWWLQYSDRTYRQCMEVIGVGGEGVVVGQDTCLLPFDREGGNQRFQLALLENGNHLIIAEHSNRCLQVVNDSTAEGALVWQVSCVTGPGRAGQEWQTPLVRENPNGSIDIMFRNALTGTCITANGATVGGGPFVNQHVCNSADPSQVWRQHLAEGGGRA